MEEVLGTDRYDMMVLAARYLTKETLSKEEMSKLELLTGKDRRSTIKRLFEETKK